MHTKHTKASTVTFMILLLIGTSFSQGTRETITNAKIVEMVKMGLSEALIVSKISKSTCQCDTSTGAIGKLKSDKVSDAIIMAMMDATPGNFSESRPASGDAPSQSKAPTVEPSDGEKYLKQIVEPGIYLFENGKMTMIEPTVYSGSKSSFWGTALTYGIKKSKIRATVRGKSANTQVSTRRPEFYFVFSREFSNPGAVMSGFGGYSATSPNEFMMIQMKVKGNSREAELGEYNAYSSSTGAADKDVREYSFDKLKPGLYKVVPKTDLAVGEYCFYYAGTNGAGSKVFDFSVK
ncbi:MAG: hypothetical protein IPG58_15695 [Acidobacteria bacterium]|nr:hypothetical protein [Acidobacteriota bacterium]